MTNRAGRDEAVHEVVRPFRMAASSLNCPIQSMSGDLLNMESSISSLLFRPSITDFSPFDALPSESSEASARHESQSSQLDSQQIGASDLNEVSREKKPPVFSFRRSVPSSSAESSRDALNTRGTNRVKREPRTDALGLLESLANGLLSQRHQASGNPLKSRDVHRTRMNPVNTGSFENASDQRRLSGNSFDPRANDYSPNPLEAMADQFILDNGLSEPLERGGDMVDMFLKGIG